MSTDSKAPVTDGVLEKTDDGRDLIRFERRLAHPVESVWAALTEPDELIRWWGEAEVEPVEGGRYTLRWLNTDEEGNTTTLNAVITKLDPQRLLELTGDWGGETTVLRWELRPEADGTLLTFENVLDLPEGFGTKTAAGWHWHLDALVEALDGRSADLATNPGWERLHEQYAAKYS